MRTAIAVIIGISVIAGTATMLAYPMASIALIRLQPSEELGLANAVSK